MHERSSLSPAPFGFSLTVDPVQNLFDEMYYSDLDGGILEAFGRLLKHNVRIYVYPALDNSTGELVSAETLQVGVITCIVMHQAPWATTG